MKKIFFSHNYIILLIYTLGLLHWLFFFFFVDYYSYHNIEPTSKIEIHQNDLHNINIHSVLRERGDFKGDKAFLRNSISEKKINFFKLFKYEQFERNDWSKENKYQNIIAYSLRNFQMPFHVTNFSKLVVATDKFLGSPNYTLSPQIILLYFFDSEIFSILNLFLMFTFGFIGCLLIKNYFKLNSLSFFLFFIIFNFNGYWVEKFSSYGPGFLGYFFLPYVFYFILRLSEIENRDTQREYYWSILTGLFLSLILLQGSFHLYVEMITFVVFWSIVNVKFWKASLLIYITTFSTSLMRLFPAMLSYGVGPNPHALESNYGGGYPLDLEVFISSLVSTTKFFLQPGYAHEFSLYISMPGFLLLVYFGLWASFINDPWRKFHQWKSFAIPCILITAISFHKIKFIILPNFIPLLNAESITTRYMIVPLIFISIIAVINFQGFIEKFFSITKIKFVSYFLVITTALFLFNHSRVWRNHRQDSVQEWTSIFDPTSYQNSTVELFVSNDYSDHFYIYTFYISLLLSIISTIFFVKLLLKLHRKNRNV